MSTNYGYFHGCNIGLSISESPDLGKHGFGAEHVRYFMVELAQQLLKTSATLVYGGDLGYNSEFNFVSLLSDMVKHYRLPGSSKKQVINFVAYPFYKRYDAALLAELMSFVEIHNVKPSFRTEEVDVSEMVANKNGEYNEKWHQSMLDLRQALIAATDARIVIGGKTADFKGKYPGIRQEAYMMLEANKPVYVIGCFGGASWDVAKDLDQGRLKLEESDRAFSTSDLNNGLSQEQNLELFYSDDLKKVTRLLLRGLKNKLMVYD